jgi:hypothetical protein
MGRATDAHGYWPDTALAFDTGPGPRQPAGPGTAHGGSPGDNRSVAGDAVTARPGDAIGAIPSFRGSVTHQVAVALLDRHRDDGTGRCASCQCSVPCPTRTHAATTCIAAGDSPPAAPAHAVGTAAVSYRGRP